MAPLDWGLGHATRSIPVIHALLKAGAQVKLAGSGASLTILKSHFPLLEARVLPAYEVRFKSIWSLLPQLPHIFRTIAAERRVLADWVQEGWVDAVVSDNRYGLWHESIPSACMCHQLGPIPPFGGTMAHRILHRLHRQYLNRFDEIWVPDVSGLGNISGILSQPFAAQYPALRWLGPLSRLNKENEVKADSYDVVALISGPEPQRSIFEKTITKQLQQTNAKSLIIQGLPGSLAQNQANHIHTISFMDGPELAQTLLNADIVIARPGYSSLMDFAKLGLHTLILSPTPGQTEQRYLGKKLQKEGVAWVEPQATFSLERALKNVEDCHGFRSNKAYSSLLEKAAEEFLSKILS
ncbi:MAG: glycosyltransferase [Bacteroidia bacterium]